MLAYCLNSPPNYVDPSGDLAFPGEIHNEVRRRVARAHGFYEEQRIDYEIGYGRADLISPTGEVWDVKRDKELYIRAGEKQVSIYVSNTWRNNPGVPLSVGGYIEGDNFLYNSGNTTYSVTYYYAGNGVIVYDYALVKIDKLTVPNVMGQAIVMGALVGCVSGFMLGIGFSNKNGNTANSSF